MLNLSETGPVPQQKTPAEKVKDVMNYGFDILDQFDYFKRSYKQEEVWTELIKYNKQQLFEDFFSTKVDFLKLRFYSLKYKRYGNNILIDSVCFKRVSNGINITFHFYYKKKPSSQMVAYYDLP